MCTLLAVQSGCGSDGGQDNGEASSDPQPDIVLESVRVGEREVTFYVDFESDSAVLGFAVADDSGRRRFFPMYGSTYRGLPAVTLDVYVSVSQDELWVRSSWPGYETLAYHRMGTNRCITRYGEITAFAVPTPDRISGAAKPFPAMDLEAMTMTASIVYEGGSP